MSAIITFICVVIKVLTMNWAIIVINYFTAVGTAKFTARIL